MRIKADFTLLLVSIVWGSAFVAQRVAGQMNSVYLFNGARYLLAALAVLPFAIRSLRDARRGDSPPASAISRAQFKWMLIAGFLLFMGSALQQAGVVYTTAGNAGFITALYVVFVPLILFFGWRERLHWLAVVAVGMAVGGAYLLSTGGRFAVHAGDALELICAVFWALHLVILGKFASQFEANSFSVGQLAVCGLLNLLVGLFVEKSPPLNWSFLAAVGYTAFFSLGLCYTLQVWAQRHTPPADAALILSLESVFAVLTGWQLLGETLAPIQIVGCALIFAAVILSQFREWTSGKMDKTRLVEGR